MKSKVKKPKTYATIKKETWAVFSKYIRLRDALLTTGTKTHARCVTCPEVIDIREMNAGHFKHNAYDYDERNVHAQCVHCNKWLSGNLAMYSRFMIDTYGEMIAHFFYDVKDTKVYTKDELLAIKEEYKNLYKDTYANN